MIVAAVPQQVRDGADSGVVTLVPVVVVREGEYRSVPTSDQQVSRKLGFGLEDFRGFLQGMGSLTMVIDGAAAGTMTVSEIRIGRGLGCEETCLLDGSIKYSEKYGSEAFNSGRDVLFLSEGLILERTCATMRPNDSLQHEVDTQVSELLGKSGEQLTGDKPRYRFIRTCDVQGDSAPDLVLTDFRADLTEARSYEPAGEQTEVGSFCIASLLNGKISPLKCFPVSFYVPDLLGVVDLDGDGNSEVVIRNGYGEAWHFEVWRYSGKDGLKMVFAGTEHGC